MLILVLVYSQLCQIAQASEVLRRALFLQSQLLFKANLDNLLAYVVHELILYHRLGLLFPLCQLHFI